MDDSAKNIIKEKIAGFERKLAGTTSGAAAKSLREQIRRHKGELKNSAIENTAPVTMNGKQYRATGPSMGNQLGKWEIKTLYGDGWKEVLNFDIRRSLDQKFNNSAFQHGCNKALVEIQNKAAEAGVKLANGNNSPAYKEGYAAGQKSRTAQNPYTSSDGEPYRDWLYGRVKGSNDKATEGSEKTGSFHTG